MSSVKCAYCQSVYVDYKGENVTAEGKQKKYYCHSCKSEFLIPEGDPQPKGEKIATFFGDNGPFDHKHVELYKTVTEEFYTYSQDYKTYKLQNHSPKIYVERYGTSDVRFHIVINTFTGRNDSNGTLCTVYRIELNDAYTAEALKNDAMRAAYDSKRGLFDIADNNNYAMLRDIANWLSSMAGVPVQETHAEKTIKFLGGLFGKKK